MYILGINAAFHDSAACLIKDGQLIAAAEDERFTHIKHGKRPTPFTTYELPYHAIHYCLNTAGIHINDVDLFGYSFDPSLIRQEGENDTTAFYNDANAGSLDKLFLTYIEQARAQLTDGYPHHLQSTFYNARIDQEKWRYLDHHLCHAASAFLCSPYEEAAVMTLDGRGEHATTTYNIGKQNEISRINEVNMPHSLGMLYEQVTTHLGFLHSSDEYKVMAVASFGKPSYSQYFLDAIHVGADGKYTIDTLNLEEAFGPARKKNEPLTALHFDIAHSLQHALEETTLSLVNWMYEQYSSENLVLAGGVALNCVLNARIRDRGPFKNIWIQPAAGDAGTALGAALWLSAQLQDDDKKTFVMEHAYWGPEYSDETIEHFLKWSKLTYRRTENVAAETAALLAEDKIIAWFQGRMEFGPRALGSRSILASPLNPSMQARLNEVKDREDFRPVAPVVLEEKASEWFHDAHYSPFMLFIYDVISEKASKIPAVTHTDGTARIQTINRDQHPLYYDLLYAFYKKTGMPVLVNTSFNTLGKPIVCTPRDAVECFYSSPFDALVIGSFILEK